VHPEAVVSSEMWKQTKVLGPPASCARGPGRGRRRHTVGVLKNQAVRGLGLRCYIDPAGRGLLVGVLVGVGLLFEIWIVDASILQPTPGFLWGLVVCLFMTHAG
jgi:hypothetical protein